MGCHGYHANLIWSVVGHMTYIGTCDVCKALSFLRQYLGSSCLCCVLCVLCSERFEWDTVDTILDMAREHLQGFAIITVSSAEVKIVKGTTLLHSHEKL